MPELPEVQTVLDTLEKQIQNDSILDIDILYSKIVTNDDSEFKKALINNQFIGFKRRGKFLIFEMLTGFLITHLRMEGKFYISFKPLMDKHIHLVFKLSSNRYLSYHDVRKFGRLHYVNSLDESESLSRLGLEYKDLKFTARYLKEKFKNKLTPIKSVLLDQSIVCGIGNIYANEILFDANISPLTPASKLSLVKCQRIVDSTHKILDCALSMGGTTIRSYTSSLGVTGLFQQKLMVHNQKTCQICEQPILKIKVNQRGTYYCPHCQK